MYRLTFPSPAPTSQGGHESATRRGTGSRESELVVRVHRVQLLLLLLLCRLSHIGMATFQSVLSYAISEGVTEREREIVEEALPAGIFIPKVGLQYCD